MTLDDSLKVERYRFVTSRLGYFTDLAKETFSSFTRTFAALFVGAFALISTRKQLDLDPVVVIALLKAIAVLLTFAAAISVIQIGFCVKRWYGFRAIESEINPAAPNAEPWAWLFEGMYCLAIVVAVVVAWWGTNHIAALLQAVSVEK